MFTWEKIKGLIPLVIKFGIAGVIAVLIDFAITYALKEKLKINKYIANSFGFCFSALVNFFINKYWSFIDNDPNVVTQLLKFALIIGIGLIINNFFLWYIHKKRNVKFYFAKILAIFCTTVWNFFGNYFFTFAH